MNKHETTETIIKWHTDTFPDTRLEKQLEKYEEEMTEVADAVTSGHRKEELADVFIVLCGIKRFSDDVFLTKWDSFLNVVDYLGYDLEQIKEYVDKKMAINRNRQWTSVDGLYKHK